MVNSAEPGVRRGIQITVESRDKRGPQARPGNLLSGQVISAVRWSDEILFVTVLQLIGIGATNPVVNESFRTCFKRVSHSTSNPKDLSWLGGNLLQSMR
jgi:hypothetical protein